MAILVFFYICRVKTGANYILTFWFLAIFFGALNIVSASTEGAHFTQIKSSEHFSASYYHANQSGINEFEELVSQQEKIVQDSHTAKSPLRVPLIYLNDHNSSNYHNYQNFNRDHRNLLASQIHPFHFYW